LRGRLRDLIISKDHFVSDLTKDEPDSSKTGFQDWKDLFHAALVELDETKLLSRIATARNAIAQRTEELSSQLDHRQEKTELTDALNSLRTLQTITRKRSQ
jgi:hypothetical protein